MGGAGGKATLVNFWGENKQILMKTSLIHLLSVAEINTFIGAAADQLNVPVA